jgi:NTE family protein
MSIEAVPKNLDNRRLDDDGACLCLSGGGFRATVFHLGAVIRLNELGVLSKLSTVVSVSGGSILNGVLATRWKRLRCGPNGVYENLIEEVARPIREFCSRDLRTPLLLGARLNPRNWGRLLRDGFALSANHLSDAYDGLCGCTLGELPRAGPHTPRFVFCATNVRTGACWQIHGGPFGRMGDYYTGYCSIGDLRVSDAVAASSAFPPAFGAFRLRLASRTELSRIDPWGRERPASSKRGHQLHHPRGQPVLLTDGGVYDNLGVEPVWDSQRTLLVSDAGQPFSSTAVARQSLVARLRRAAAISMEQVGAVRKRWLVEECASGRRTGALWTLGTMAAAYPARSQLVYDGSLRLLLARVRTDLDGFGVGERACLENHGYSLADAAVLSYSPSLCLSPIPASYWPHEEWSQSAKAQAALANSHKRQILRDAARWVRRIDRARGTR